MMADRHIVDFVALPQPQPCRVNVTPQIPARGFAAFKAALESHPQVTDGSAVIDADGFTIEVAADIDRRKFWRYIYRSFSAIE